MKKVIRDGKVAVIYSPGFGAGWYTWNYDQLEYHENPYNDYEALLFDPILVELVEELNENYSGVERAIGWYDDVKEKIYTRAEELVPDGYFSAHQLKIKWLPVGTKFCIKEDSYGNETIFTIDEIEWKVA